MRSCPILCDLRILWVSACLLYYASATATITSPPQPSNTPAAREADGTCESRTVNYITHSLISVCLRNGRLGVLADHRTDLEVESSTQTLDVPTGRSEAYSTVSESSLPSSEPTTTEEELGALDEGSFLSFEDWKKQTQQKAEHTEDAKQRELAQGTLEAPGDDNPLDMDIHAIIGERQRASSPSLAARQEPQPHGGAAVASLAGEVRRHRSKDAGKTCKERFNFASVDAGAQVMKANPEAKSTSALLKENRDVYMLNVCQAKNKFIIIELSDSIYVETVALANFEFFSSTFRHFRLSVSAKYPVKIDKWVDLGVFEAQNSREIQAFLIENPMIEARYLRIEFMSHFGNEFYCPVSLLRVHGQTMLQEVMSWERATSGDYDEDDSDEAETQTMAPVDSSPVDEIMVDASNKDEGMSSTSMSIHESIAQAIEKTASVTISPMDRDPVRSPDSHMTMEPETADHNALQLTCKNMSKAGMLGLLHNATTTCPARHYNNSGGKPSCIMNCAQPSPMGATITEPIHEPVQVSTTTGPSILSPTTTHVDVSTTTPSMATSGANITITSDVRSSQHPVPTNDSTPHPIANITSHVWSSTTSSSSITKSSRTASSSSAQPTTQESFFKTVTKRLQLLEANSTLSLKYIEEQSRILREAFNKVEKRQLSKTTSFLETLNATVLSELSKFGQGYDQMWQSTVIELETQREASKRELAAVTSRLNVLADELVFQKRMSIVQSILLLLCLSIVVFSKAFNNLDVATLQSLLASPRSPSRWNSGGVDKNPLNYRAGGRSIPIERNHVRGGSDESDLYLEFTSREVSPPAEASASARRAHLSGARVADEIDHHALDEQYSDGEGAETILSPLGCGLPVIPDPLTTEMRTPLSEGRQPHAQLDGSDQTQCATYLKESIEGIDSHVTPSVNYDGLIKKVIHLPSPPPDSDRRHEFSIARKPLPSLPHERE